MTPFEKQVEKSFAEYLTAGTAFLQFLYPKMRMAGYIDKTPAFVQCAKAPYDIDGFYLTGGARYIACEVKENGDRHTSLKIIPPEKRGTGLQYHQLEALVRVHVAGGVACVLWNNGGDIGYLDGTRLKAAKAAMDTSLKAEKQGLPNAARGMRSILWGNFVPIKTTATGTPLWLPSPLPPPKPRAVESGGGLLAPDESTEPEPEDGEQPVNDEEQDGGNVSIIRIPRPDFFPVRL